MLQLFCTCLLSLMWLADGKTVEVLGSTFEAELLVPLSLQKSVRPNVSILGLGEIVRLI